MTTEIFANSRKLVWTDEQEILGMGGPWVGNLYLDDKWISDNVLADNALVDSAKTRIYFVKYNRVSKWRDENFFTLQYYDWTKGAVFHLNGKAYDMLYLESIEVDQIAAHRAFHNQTLQNRFFIDCR
jgi:hypothetical protein